MSDIPAKPQKARFKISLSWPACVFALFFLPLLISLGFWQIQRAEEKRTIQQLLEQQQALPPQPIANIRSDIDAGRTVLYRRGKSTGTFEQGHYWLIENRTYRGRNGFHVVAPFYPSSGGALLVNRGWISGTGYREQLPEVLMPKGEVIVIGQMVHPSDNKLLSAEARPTGDWPRVILQVDVGIMAKELGQPLLPLLMQIDAESPSALQVYWTVVNVPVSKHLGYAYQWFAMALALIMLTVFANSNLAQILKKGRK